MEKTCGNCVSLIRLKGGGFVMSKAFCPVRGIVVIPNDKACKDWKPEKDRYKQRVRQ